MPSNLEEEEEEEKEEDEGEDADIYSAGKGSSTDSLLR